MIFNVASTLAVLSVLLSLCGDFRRVALLSGSLQFASLLCIDVTESTSDCGLSYGFFFTKIVAFHANLYYTPIHLLFDMLLLKISGFWCSVWRRIFDISRRRERVCVAIICMLLVLLRQCFASTYSLPSERSPTHWLF